MSVTTTPSRISIAACAAIALIGLLDTPGQATIAHRATDRFTGSQIGTQTHAAPTAGAVRVSRAQANADPVRNAGTLYTSGNVSDCLSVALGTAPIADVASTSTTFTVTVLAKKTCFSSTPTLTLRKVIVTTGAASAITVPALGTDKTWPGGAANSAYGVTTATTTVARTSWIELSATTTTGVQTVTALVRLLQSRSRRGNDAQDVVTGPLVHAVYVVPSDVADKQRDSTGEIDAWLQQMQGYLNATVGKKLRLDLDSNNFNDITYIKSNYSSAQLFSANQDADKLLKQELVDRAIMTGSQKKVLAFFIESSSAATYCGYSRDSWNDASPAVVIGPIASSGCAKLAPAGVEYVSTVLAHEIFHTLGVKHVPDAKDLMCGSDSGVTCTGPVGVDVQRTYYVGTSSAYSSVDVLTQDVWDRGPSTVPTAPSKVTVKRAVNSIDVSWTAPTSDGGAPIDGYIVTATPGGGQCRTAAGVLGCSVTGLFNTNVYTFVVEASNINGLSPKSVASAEVRPSTAPSTPTNVRTRSGDGTVRVLWDIPSDDGGLALTYTATLQPGDVSCTTTNLSCAVDGLNNGSTYLVTVIATNDVGNSAASTEITGTPGTVPKSPTGVKVVRGNGRVTVSWNPPTDTGGFDVKSYTVYSNPGRATCQTTQTTCAVLGLRNGQSYTFSVVAQNDIGVSAASGQALEPAVSAGSGALCAIKTDGSGTCWGSPRLTPSAGQYASIATGQNYGCGITTARKVQCYGTNTAVTASVPLTLTTAAEISTGYAHACAVTKDQRLRCWGNNTSGETNVPADLGTVNHTAVGLNQSCASTTTGTIRCWGQDTFGSVTAAPKAVLAVTSLSAGQGFVCATFATREITCWGDNSRGQTNVPASIGAVISVTAGANHACAITVQASVVCWGDATSPAITPPADLLPTAFLAAGDGFTCALSVTQAITCWGQSINASTVSDADNQALNRLPAMIPGSAPAAATAVQLTRAKRALEVRWTSPADNGGFAITGYTATATPGSLSCSTAGLVCTITGLTNGVVYQVTVRATNAIGDSVASTSASLAPGTVPDAPIGVKLTRGYRELRVDWSAPGDDGGFAVQTYLVTASPGGFTCGPTASTTCTLTGLTNGTVYSVSVAATNMLGTGALAAGADTAPGTVTSVPLALSTSRGDKQVTVSWSAPADNGGFPVTGYTVDALPSGNPCSTAGATSCTVTGLTNGIEYSFRVCALNFLGCSTYSDAVSGVPAAPPGPPTNISITPGDKQISAFWAIGETGGLPTSVTVTANPGGFTCTGALSCVITGLVNGTGYNVTLTATNAAGAAPSTDPVVSMPATLSTPPLNVRTTVGNAQLVIAWDAPSDTGGLVVLSYTATAAPGGATCTATNATTCIIAGLTNGTAYSITVTASNTLGASQPSTAATGTPVAPAKPPAAPAGLKLTNTAAGQVKLAYTNAVANGAPVTRYDVCTSTDGKKWTAWATLNQSTKLIKGAWKKGQTLYVQLRAVNAAGIGAVAKAQLKLTK